jgi:hypothetical protein
MTTSRLESLDDYLSGTMPDDTAHGFEEELFAVAAAGAAGEAEFVDRVAEIGRFLVSRSGMAMGTSRKRVDELLASDLKVHYFDAGPPGAPVVIPAWGDGIDVVITRIGIDTRGYEHVDVEITGPDGNVLKTIRDVEGAEDGAFYAACEGPLARLAFALGPTVSRITGMRGGKRELIAELRVIPETRTLDR